jgi:acetyltransferase-like isoleucine patch superfamily enzyme
VSALSSMVWRNFRLSAVQLATSQVGVRVRGSFGLLRNEVRSSISASKLRSCGKGVIFRYPIKIEFPENVEIGNRVSLGTYLHIWGAERVSIGNNVLIGSHVAISSVTHDYTLENMFDSVVAAPISIEDDAWIGTHAVILPGVTVGKGAVIAAGCVVTEDVPPRSIVAGVPGRVVKVRPPEDDMDPSLDVDAPGDYRSARV